MKDFFFPFLKEILKSLVFGMGGKFRLGTK